MTLFSGSVCASLSITDILKYTNTIKYSNVFTCLRVFISSKSCGYILTLTEVLQEGIVTLLY